MRKKLVKGLKVRRFSLVIMAVCCVLTGFYFHTSITMKQKHEELVFMMNDYSSCTHAIMDFRVASGKLTYYALCFLEKMDFDYLDRYFYELNVINRRNKSINVVELTHKDDIAGINAVQALHESDYLLSVELYSFALMCDALDAPKSQLPDQINNIILTEEDLSLSSEEKIERARSFIFSHFYLNSRDRISQYTDVAANSLINIYNSEKSECDKFIHDKSVIQIVLLSVLTLIYISLYLILVITVFIPLHRHLIAIQKNDRMDVKGAYEVQYIATAYNAVADKNALDASALKHKAEHDHLTGLINREAFDEIISVLSATKEPVAYLLIDIDLFKSINDEYGHSVGDKVLVKIAHLLTDQFRATDYVARIGGDEFAVIMTKFGTASVMEIIRRKIDGLNQRLQNDYDDLPAVSLSVGVAVSDTGFKTSLIENADKALYHVKRGGRCNCYFYGAE